MEGVDLSVFGAVEVDPQPVEIMIRRDHAFKKKPSRMVVPKGGGKAKKVQPAGCLHCNMAMTHHDHFGVPPSMNQHSIAFNKNAFDNWKSAWQHLIALRLDESGLPRGLKAVFVEVLFGVERYVPWDEDNFRWMLSKATGDALQSGYDDGELGIHITGGWLEDDQCWPQRRYSMGNLEGVHSPRESWCQMRFFPSMTEPEISPRVDR